MVSRDCCVVLTHGAMGGLQYVIVVCPTFCIVSKHSVTHVLARSSVHCNLTFVISNFVTECLPKVGALKE